MAIAPLSSPGMTHPNAPQTHLRQQNDHNFLKIVMTRGERGAGMAICWRDGHALPTFWRGQWPSRGRGGQEAWPPRGRAVVAWLIEV